MKSLQGWVLAGLALILLSYRLLPHRAGLAKTPHAKITARAPSFTIEAVTSALRAGSIHQLSTYIDDGITIELPERSDTYSKSQAEMVMRDFFADIVVHNFRVVNQGQSGGFYFCTGILSSRSGKYLTTIFLKNRSNRQYLDAIRFQQVPETNP